MFSVLIMTFNEEKNIIHSIRSCSELIDDIHVLDSYSTDNTKSICLNENVIFHENEFNGYASQRNYALNEIVFKYDWVLMLDADEILTVELFNELIEKLNNINNDEVLGCFRRKDFFQGRWIKRSSGYPTWFGRFIKIGHVSIQREINEEYIPNGNEFYLNGHIEHFPFNKGLYSWIEKHNNYSTMEAIKLKNIDKIVISNFFSVSKTKRRAELKKILYRLPFRPLVVFIYLYIIKFGFLDGKAGFNFALLRTFYEFLINLKKDEFK